MGFDNNIEMELKGKSRKTINTYYSSQILHLKDQPHILTVIYDITELKQTEQKVILLNKELEAFSYSVSHDLRAPLRSINGYANILVEDFQDKLNDEGRKVLASIIRNANRMGQLIDDMLNFSRVGRSVIKVAVIDMNSLVKKILSELPAPENKMTRIEQKLLLPGKGDLDLITQVWTNYLINAIKFSSKKTEPVIEVGSRTHEEEVIYYVQDNGAGFDNQYNHKLFGVFQRLHKQSDFDGTGVGLAIVKRIVERHSGRVWAEGMPGQGANFYFSLPITPKNYDNRK
jgi:light-regulated signal transduction histidine kinase (bacteriophytochrome)